MCGPLLTCHLPNCYATATHSTTLDRVVCDDHATPNDDDLGDVV